MNASKDETVDDGEMKKDDLHSNLNKFSSYSSSLPFLLLSLLLVQLLLLRLLPPIDFKFISNFDSFSVFHINKIIRYVTLFCSFMSVHSGYSCAGTETSTDGAEGSLLAGEKMEC